MRTISEEQMRFVSGAGYDSNGSWVGGDYFDGNETYYAEDIIVTAARDDFSWYDFTSSYDHLYVSTSDFDYNSGDTVFFTETQTSVPHAFFFTGLNDVALQGAVTQAFDYLKASTKAVQVLNDAQDLGIKIHRSDGDTYAIINHATGQYDVYWNPAKGVLHGGELISPAVTLIHEIGHVFTQLSSQPNAAAGAYGNLADQWVIQNIEQVVATQLGEHVRYDHNGSMWSASSVKDTTP